MKRITSLFLVTVALVLATGQPANATVVSGSYKSVTITSQPNHRKVEIAVQLEIINGQIRSDAHVKCMNSVGTAVACFQILVEPDPTDVRLVRDGSIVADNWYGCNDDNLPLCPSPQMNASSNWVTLTSQLQLYSAETVVHWVSSDDEGDNHLISAKFWLKK